MIEPVLIRDRAGENEEGCLSLIYIAHFKKLGK